MKVRIIGDGPAAAVLAGVLAAEQQEVVWYPDADRRLKALRRNKEIRLNLPWGWLRTEGFQLSSSPLIKVGELGVIARRTRPMPAAATRAMPADPQRAIGGRDKTLLVLDSEPGEQDAQSEQRSFVPGTTVLRGLSLLEALEWDPGVVEVSAPQPRLIVEAGGRLGELQRCLKARRITVQEVGDLAPYRNALRIRELLSLPVALCHSTLGNFLSYPEGREIAVSLLEEGLQLYAHRGLPLGKLPLQDPRDLLQRLRRKPQEFDRVRMFPDRAYGEALHRLLAGDAGAAKHPHDRIVRMSAQTGIDPRWNWAVAQRLNRAIRVGFYRDPVELYNALAR
jgi:hypothetical protein